MPKKTHTTVAGPHNVDPSRHPRAAALLAAEYWPQLPIRFRTAVCYAAGHLEWDAILPADATPATVLHWLTTTDALRLPMVGITTREQVRKLLSDPPLTFPPIVWPED